MNLGKIRKQGRIQASGEGGNNLSGKRVWGSILQLVVADGLNIDSDQFLCVGTLVDRELENIYY